MCFSSIVLSSQEIDMPSKNSKNRKTIQVPPRLHLRILRAQKQLQKDFEKGLEEIPGVNSSEDVTVWRTIKAAFDYFEETELR